jgi:hypothetical protein
MDKIPKHIEKTLLHQSGGMERLIDFDITRREALKRGIQQNQKRAADSRAKWRDQANRIRQTRAYLDMDQLACEVHRWCISNCVRMGNGRHYALRTILDDLKKNLPQ